MKFRLLNRLSRGLLVLASLALVVPSSAAEGTCGLTGVRRVVAVGDVHGSYDNLVKVLTLAGLLDRSGHWGGGKAVLVQVGDVLDRGVQTRPALDLLMLLEKEARQAGGRVIVLLGNHEVMNIMGDLSAVQAAEYGLWKPPDPAGSRTPGNKTPRKQYVDTVTERAREEAKAAGQPFDEQAYRQKVLEQTPPGFVEREQALSPQGKYGKWVREHEVIATVNGVAFLHGGLTPEVAALGCERINRQVRTELGADLAKTKANPRAALATEENGPLNVPRPRAGRRSDPPPLRREGTPVHGGEGGRDRPHAHRRREDPPSLWGAGSGGRRGDAGGFGGHLAALEMGADGSMTAIYPTGRAAF